MPWGHPDELKLEIENFEFCFLGSMHGQGCKGTSGQTVNGEPLSLYRWKWCLCIDLNERIVASEENRVASETLTAGGSQSIPEVHFFAKTRLRRTASDHSQHFWV